MVYNFQSSLLTDGHDMLSIEPTSVGRAYICDSTD